MSNSKWKSRSRDSGSAAFQARSQNESARARSDFRETRAESACITSSVG